MSDSKSISGGVGVHNEEPSPRLVPQRSEAIADPSPSGSNDYLADSIDICIGELTTRWQADSIGEKRFGDFAANNPGAFEDRLQVQWLPNRARLDVFGLERRNDL